MNCPNCGKPTKSDWIICPTCGTKIKEAKEHLKPDLDRFICPGCQGKSSAKKGFHCESCKAFVHYECVVKGKQLGSCIIDLYDINQCLCPICEAILGEGNYGMENDHGKFQYIECITPKVNENDGTDKNKHTLDKFTCPGCGEASAANTGKMCKICMAFVHDACLLPGPEVCNGSEGSEIASECETVTWREGLCPICQRAICNGYFTKGKFHRNL